MRHLALEGVQVSANTQVGRRNRRELSGVFDTIADAGAHSWQIQLTVAAGRVADDPSILLEPYHMLEVMPAVARLKARADSADVRIWPGNNLGYYGPFEELLRGKLPGGRRGSCGAGRFSIGIESNGSIKGCPSLPEAYVGGNVRDNRLRDVWERAEPLRFTRGDRLPELWGHCAGCYYADDCLGAARGRRILCSVDAATIPFATTGRSSYSGEAGESGSCASPRLRAFPSTTGGSRSSKRSGRRPSSRAPGQSPTGPSRGFWTEPPRVPFSTTNYDRPSLSTGRNEPSDALLRMFFLWSLRQAQRFRLPVLRCGEPRDDRAAAHFPSAPQSRTLACVRIDPRRGRLHGRCCGAASRSGRRRRRDKRQSRGKRGGRRERRRRCGLRGNRGGRRERRNDAASDDGVEEPSAADAATDTAACDACDVGSDGGVPFASADGSFPCSPYRDATACDRRTQWCAGHNGGFSYSCVSLDTTCSYGPGCTSPDFYWDAAACDGGYQRCVCATVTCSGMGSNGRGFCNDDDAGGVTVTCGTCYGAPPVRLERFVS